MMVMMWPAMTMIHHIGADIDADGIDCGVRKMSRTMQSLLRGSEGHAEELEKDLCHDCDGDSVVKTLEVGGISYVSVRFRVYGSTYTDDHQRNGN